MPVYIVVLAGEIVLKSRRTRPRFLKRLVSNIEDALGRMGVGGYRVWVDGARVFVEAPVDVSKVLERVFGVYRFGEVVEVEFKDLSDLAGKIASLAKDMVSGKKFAVRVHRTGEHGFTSIDAAREIGRLLYEYSAGVDLENPEVEVWVEIRGNKAYLYKSRINGPGGLPIGVEGRALVLFSGGFDSPVASWFIARRGVQVDFLHYIMASPQSAYLAYKVARYLAENWLYGYKPRLITADFRGVTSVIREKVKRSYRQVVLRAIMYIVGWKIAEKLGYDAIVTGESLGQASSQTLANLRAVEKTIGAKITFLRPLIGFDKEEIIEWSRRIGTHDLSKSVAEFCAIAPSLVTTKAKVHELKQELEKIPGDVIDKVVANIKILDLLNSKPDDVLPEEDIEIDYIPDEAVVIDLRSRSEYEKLRHPRAIHVSQVRDWSMFKDKIVVLYCDYGHLSYIQASMLRRQGVKAYSLRGGLSTLKKILSRNKNLPECKGYHGGTCS